MSSFDRKKDNTLRDTTAVERSNLGRFVGIGMETLRIASEGWLSRRAVRPAARMTQVAGRSSPFLP